MVMKPYKIHHRSGLTQHGSSLRGRSLPELVLQSDVISVAAANCLGADVLTHMVSVHMYQVLLPFGIHYVVPHICIHLREAVRVLSLSKGTVNLLGDPCKLLAGTYFS